LPMDENEKDESVKKEIYSYKAPWQIYGLSWSYRADKKYRIALGSFTEDYKNKVSIVQLDEKAGKFLEKGEFPHPYPPTKLMWIPDQKGTRPDLIGTTGDFLRLWEVNSSNGKITQKCVLNNNKNTEFCAPLTSFDWNITDPNLIGTSSIDTTCTIWDVTKETAKTQLIAHDKEVYDIAFARSTDLFASVGADGSVRLFDIRNLEHSTIIYETKDSQPLLRLAWNRQDEYYLATFSMDSKKVVILDIRVPAMPAAELKTHTACVNTIAWAPHSSCHISTGGDDATALIWDLSSLPKPIEDPVLAYKAEAEINQLQWSASQPDWICIAFNDTLQILRV